MRQFTTRTVSGKMASVYVNRDTGSLSGWVYDKNSTRIAVIWGDDGEADTSFFDSISPSPNMRPMDERWKRLSGLQRELILIQPNHTMFDELVECEAENCWNNFWWWFSFVMIALIGLGVLTL